MQHPVIHQIYPRDVNIIGVGLLAAAAIAGAASAWRPDGRAARLVMVAAWWLATAYLITRFVNLDLTLAVVDPC